MTLFSLCWFSDVSFLLSNLFCLINSFFFLAIVSTVGINEELFLYLKSFFLRLEVKLIGDDMQFDSWLISKLDLALFDKVEILIADKVCLAFSNCYFVSDIS